MSLLFEPTFINHKICVDLTDFLFYFFIHNIESNKTYYKKNKI